MICILPDLLHLDANFDWQNCYKNACLPNGMNVSRTDPPKLSFPLESYALRSLNVCPLVLFPAPKGCNPNPFAVLTSLTSLSFQFHALPVFMSNIADCFLPDICTCLAPLQRLEAFRLFYTKGDASSLFVIGDENRAVLSALERSFIPPQIVLTSFHHVHTLRLQFQSAAIVESISHLEHLTTLSLPMLLHPLSSKIDADLTPLARLVSLRTLKLVGLYVNNYVWTYSHLKSAYSQEDAWCRGDDDYKTLHYNFLVHLTNLRRLEMSGRGVSDSGFASIAKLTQLTQIGLRNSNLTDVSLKLLEDSSQFPCLCEMRYFSYQECKIDWWTICKDRELKSSYFKDYH
jgi:hypothetical protein